MPRRRRLPMLPARAAARRRAPSHRARRSARTPSAVPRRARPAPAARATRGGRPTRCARPCRRGRRSSSIASAAISGALASPSTSLVSSTRLASMARRIGALPPCQSIATSALRSPVRGGTRTLLRYGRSAAIGSSARVTLTVAAVLLPWPENDSLPWSVALPTVPSPLKATGASSGQAIAFAANEKSLSASSAAGEVVASRQSRRAARTESAATLACHGAAAPAVLARQRSRAALAAAPLAAALAAGVGSGSRATGVAAPDRRLGGEQQVDPAGRIANRDDVRRVDVDALDAHPPFERAKLVDRDLDVAHLEQLGRCSVDHFDAVRADRARDLQRQLRPLLEGDDEVGAQRRRAQLRRQAAWQIAEPGRDRRSRRSGGGPRRCLARRTASPRRPSRSGCRRARTRGAARP